MTQSTSKAPGPDKFNLSPIIFLIYISRVFDKVAKINPHIMSLPFVDDLEFIAYGHSTKDIVKALEKMAQTVVEWGNVNVVTYDIANTEAMIFSRSHQSTAAA